MEQLKVKDVMSKHPIIIKPEQTVRDAAQLMEYHECGVLPVGNLVEVIGILTDRDITVRVVAGNKDPDTTTAEMVMSNRLILCEEENTLEEAAERMRHHDVSRLVVTNGKIVTGIVTLADLLRNVGQKDASNAILNKLLYPARKASA